MHFGRQQHNKVLLVRRDGPADPRARGIDELLAARPIHPGEQRTAVRRRRLSPANSASCSTPTGPRPRSSGRTRCRSSGGSVRDEPASRVSLCFSPHADSALSLDPSPTAIENAESSVLYSIVFLSQLTGKVRDALDELMDRSLFSYGVAQRTGGLTVRKPDGSRRAACRSPTWPRTRRSRSSPSGPGRRTGHSNMVHHKFLVTDFNGDRRRCSPARPTWRTGARRTTATT